MQSQKKLLESQKSDSQPTSDSSAKVKMNSKPPGFSQELPKSSQSTTLSQPPSSLKETLSQTFKLVNKNRKRKEKKEPILLDSGLFRKLPCL